MLLAFYPKPSPTAFVETPVVQRPVNTLEITGPGYSSLIPGNEAAEAPELPQVSRAFAEDARIDRLTTTNTMMRPNFTKDDEKMCVHLKILEYAYEDPEGAEDDKSGKYNTRKHEDE